jgi:AAA family ATP:ADP antiporter
MNQGKPKSLLERILSLFAEVRFGEGATALLLMLNVFLLMTSYYIMKPVREALILAGGGAELKSYMSAGQTILFLGYVPLYAKLVSRMTRRRLLNVVTLFFVACLPIFFALAYIIPSGEGQASSLALGIAFFLWIGIFNISIIAQFWSFANDLYTPEQGKRLFVIVMFGQSAGAVLGPLIAGRLVDPIGHYQLLLLAGGILGLSLLITNYVDSREKERAREVPTQATLEAEKPIGKEGAYKLVFANKYLLAIALLILFLNWVNTTGEYILGKVVTTTVADTLGTDTGVAVEKWITKFYSDFFLIVNIAGLLIQLFIVSRILKYLGVRIALLFLPIIAFGGYLLAAFYPVLSIIRWVKTAENATDYSLQNTLRGVLFLPTTREEKYKAKQAIDTIFVRAGDVLSAVLVFVGVNWLAFQTGHFALVNLAFVGIWIGLAIFVGIRFQKLSKERQ